MTLFDAEVNNLFTKGLYGETNNNSPVVVVGTPDAGFINVVQRGNFSIVNLDPNNSVTFTTAISGTSGNATIEQITLQPGDKWVSANKIVISEENSEILTVSLTNPTSTQATWTVSFENIVLEA